MTVYLHRAPASIGYGWRPKKYDADGYPYDVLTIEPVASSVARVSIPKCYLITGKTTPFSTLSHLTQGDLIANVSVGAPTRVPNNAAQNVREVGTRLGNSLFLYVYYKYYSAGMFGSSDYYSSVALLDNIRGTDPDPMILATKSVSFRLTPNSPLTDGSSSNYMASRYFLRLTPYIAPTLPDTGVIFHLGNYQTDKIETRANGDIDVYASLSARIPRGTYSWTSNLKVITEVWQENGEWKASGDYLTVTAEIYGDHWI